MNIHPSRLLPLPVLLLAAALPAARAAATDAVQADFTGKFVCVEDADNAWPLMDVHLEKIGAREFMVGEMAPPPPESPALAESPVPANEAKNHAQPGGRTPKRPLKAGETPIPKHRRVMLPVSRIVDIQVFDSVADLNAYYDALDTRTDDDGETLKVH